QEMVTIQFSSLARDYYDPVYRFIRRQSPSAEDAADITQETFLRAQKAFPKYNPNRAFAPWIYTLARRQLADFYRRRRPQEAFLENEFEDPADNPREQATSSEQAEQLWKLAAGLKPKFYQVLLLHYEEGFSVEEIARIMRLTRTHVKVLLFRARSALKSRLSKTPAQGGHLS
ncbi:MAG TPA: sigma-70 family RNA polymerase sigma factor, partial [Oceanipulchritudo sp.]|nr:sigma-70 family RNA polymerase sigma factor [Oceanipulchritudo sp.]